MIYPVISFVSIFFGLIPISLFSVSGIYLSFPLLLIWTIISLCKNKCIYIKKRNALITCSFIILILFVSCVPLLHAENYYDLIRMTSYGLFIYLNCSLLVYCHNVTFGEKSNLIILRNIYIVGTLNALVAVLVLVVPSIRSIIYSVIDTSPLNEVHLDIGMRSSGLFYFGGSIMSVFHCLIIYIGMLYASNFKRKISLYDYTCILINILGIFVSGRFGFLFLIFMFIFLMFINQKKSLVRKRIIINISLLAIVVIFLLLIEYYEHLKRLMDWGLEIFINYFESGKLESHSTDILQTMYLLPNNILFGNGVFSQIELSTDSGFILLIWYFGVIALIFYFFVFFVHFVVASSSTNIYWRNVFFVALSITLIGNFKDIYLFASNGITQIYIIALIICSSNYGEYKKNDGARKYKS